MSNIIVSALVLLERPPSHPDDFVICTQETYHNGTFERLDPPLGTGATREAAEADAADAIADREWAPPFMGDPDMVIGYWT